MAPPSASSFTYKATNCIDTHKYTHMHYFTFYVPPPFSLPASTGLPTPYHLAEGGLLLITQRLVLGQVSNNPKKKRESATTSTIKKCVVA